MRSYDRKAEVTVRVSELLSKEWRPTGMAESRDFKEGMKHAGDETFY